MSGSQLLCLVIDDEPLSREIVEGYLEKIPELQLVSSCKNALDALSIIREKKIDLLFLDINLPGISGIELLRSLSNPPMVIIISAYQDYAVEGFELEVVDYLLKPFGFDRFLKAVNKAFEKYKKIEVNHGPPGGEEFLFIKADKKIFRIEVTDIDYIQSYGDYVKIHHGADCTVAHETLKNLEDRLLPSSFLRIHKSYLINLSKINYIEGNVLVLGNNELPVGPSYRETLLKKMGSK